MVDDRKRPRSLGAERPSLHARPRILHRLLIGALSDRDQLLEQLIDAFTCGTDEYLEPLQVLVKAEEVSEMTASPELRRQLIRLRNSNELA